MRTPTTALLWQVWSQNRQATLTLVGITIVSSVADVALNHGRTANPGAGPGPINELRAIASFLLVLGIFSYTESSGDRGIGRFPHRLFTYPVSSLRLVAVPMLAGLVALEVLYLTWMGRLATGGSTSPLFIAVLLGAFMVFHQTALWTLTRFGALRLVALGAIGIGLMAVGVLPSIEVGEPSPWRSEWFLGSAVAAAALAAFLLAWRHVARLRSGGERGPSPIDALAARIRDVLPDRRSAFKSASAAQFWYEWRNAGTALPALVGGTLFLFVAPASWLLRDSPGGGMMFLLGSLMLPILLAVPLGMAFAKPVFWSEELSIPPFIGVRPLGAADIVATKLRVAALSAGISWLLVVVFLAAWVLLWGNAEWLSQFAIQLWAVLDHSRLAVYGVGAVVVTAGMILTWRFLIVGVWAGQSGSRRLYVWSVVVVLLIVLAYLLFGLDRLPGWVLADPTRVQACAWVAATTVIVKYWLAARVWRRVARPLRLRYLAVWFAGTTTFVALTMVFWHIARVYIALDIYRLQALLILLAFLVVPLTRVGLAPVLLEHNRHRR